METTVAKIYAVLPGTLDSIEEKTGLPRKKIVKTLSNMTHRHQIKGRGKKGPGRVWSINKGGSTPKHVRHTNKTTAKRRYKKRKKVKRIGFLMQFDVINTRLDTIEQLLGIN